MPIWFSFVLVFLFGLVLGSFLNVVVFRLEKGGSIFFGRSKCPHCRVTLRFIDLIPLLSFLVQKGRCRYCNQKISWQYPFVELACALAFSLVYLKTFFLNLNNLSIHNFQFVFWLFCTSVLIIIFVYDLKHYIIPNKIILPSIIAIFLVGLFRPDTTFFESLLSAFLTGGFFLFLVLVSREKWMGWGDVKLGFLVGLMLSWPSILLALFLAFVIGALIGIGLVAFGQKEWKSKVPFGTFLTTATYLTFLMGDWIIGWYLRVLGV